MTRSLIGHVIALADVGWKAQELSSGQIPGSRIVLLIGKTCEHNGGCGSKHQYRESEQQRHAFFEYPTVISKHHAQRP
jgi:hypothetical protein